MSFLRPRVMGSVSDERGLTVWRVCVVCGAAQGLKGRG